MTFTAQFTDEFTRWMVRENVKGKLAEMSMFDILFKVCLSLHSQLKNEYNECHV